MGAVWPAWAALLFTQSQLPPIETALQLAAYATPGGAVLVALLVLWVGVENIRALLWFNTQAEQPGGRFGLLPFVAASLLYLGVLLLYVWNNGALAAVAGPAPRPAGAAAAGRGGRLAGPAPAGAQLRARGCPIGRGAAQLYPLLVMGAAGALAYAFATANTPLLVAARSFTGAGAAAGWAARFCCMC